MNKKTILKVTTVVYALFFAGFISSCKNNNKHEVKPVEKEIPVGTFCYKDEGRTAEMLNYTELVKMLTEYDTTRKIPLEKATTDKSFGILCPVFIAAFIAATAADSPVVIIPSTLFSFKNGVKIVSYSL